MSIRFTPISINQLSGYVAQPAFRRMPHLPLTLERAESLRHHPLAQPKDTVLILATNKQDELLGFIGALPDTLRQTGQRMAWLSGWWVHPEKGGNSALALFFQLYKAWNGQLWVTDFTPTVEKMVQATRLYHPVVPAYGIRLYFKLFLNEILAHRRTTRWQQVARAADKAGNLLLAPYQLIGSTWYRAPLRWQAANPAEAREIQSFISQHGGSIGECNWEKWQWAQRYPWVRSQAQASDWQAARYPFSLKAGVFAQHLHWLCTPEGEKVALLWLTNHDKHWKVPYAWIIKEKAPEVATTLRIKTMEQHAKSLTTFHPALVNAFRHRRFPAPLAKQQRNGLLVPQQVNLEEISVNAWQMGEGDAFFT